MSALQKERLRCQNYEKRKHIAKGLAQHANCVTEKEYLVQHADFIYIEESDDKTIIVTENSGRSKQKRMVLILPSLISVLWMKFLEL